MPVETTEYLAMVGRMLRAAGRRVAEADEPELQQLIALRAEMDEIIRDAVLGQRANLDRSWTWVGEALGLTRQGARQRYLHSTPESTRQAG
jgi:hypothetical protein